MASARPASVVSADSSRSNAALSRSRLFSKSLGGREDRGGSGQGRPRFLCRHRGPSPAWRDRRRLEGRFGRHRSTPGRLRGSPPSGRDGVLPGQEQWPIPPRGGRRRGDDAPDRGRRRADPPGCRRPMQRRLRRPGPTPVHRGDNRDASPSSRLEPLDRASRADRRSGRRLRRPIDPGPRRRPSPARPGCRDERPGPQGSLSSFDRARDSMSTFPDSAASSASTLAPAAATARRASVIASSSGPGLLIGLAPTAGLLITGLERGYLLVQAPNLLVDPRRSRPIRH